MGAWEKRQCYVEIHDKGERESGRVKEKAELARCALWTGFNTLKEINMSWQCEAIKKATVIPGCLEGLYPDCKK